MTTYYIDPDASVDGTGTIYNPFNTWSSVLWKAGNTYLQKAGTTANETVTIGSSGSKSRRIIIGEYGGNTKPIINGTTRAISGFDKSYWTAVNLELKSAATQHAIYPAKSDATTTLDVLIDSCLISQAGAAGIWYQGVGLTILDTTIHNCTQDGVIGNGDNFTFNRGSIYDVDNGASVGDCIQLLTNCNDVEIKDSSFDGTGILTKQCIIIQGAGTKGSIEGCTFTGLAGTAGAVVHVDTVTNFIINSNYIKGGSRSITCTSDGSRIFSNILLNPTDVCVHAIDGSIEIYNNIFSGYGSKAIYSAGGTSCNIIEYNNIYTSSATRHFIVASPTVWTSDYNCYVESSGTEFSYNGLAYNFADYKTASGQDANSITGSAGFIDYAGEDFNLSSNSQCVGAGTNIIKEFDRLRDYNKNRHHYKQDMGAIRSIRPSSASRRNRR